MDTVVPLPCPVSKASNQCPVAVSSPVNTDRPSFLLPAIITMVNPLWNAANDGDVDKVSQLLKDGAFDVDEKGVCYGPPSSESETEFIPLLSSFPQPL